MKKFTRDDTEHGKEYYLASDVDALLAQPAQQEAVAIEHCLWARNGNTPCPHTTPPAAQPEQKRPQNCGTGYCSCIECVMEPPQRK
jgi:hypothetical protein